MFDLETGEQESRMVRWDAVVRCGWRGLLDGPGAGEGASLAEAGLATTICPSHKPAHLRTKSTPV